MDSESKQSAHTTPQLTLNPELENTPVVQQTDMTESELTADEKQMVADFAARINVENSEQILQYGAGVQKKMADFSDSALENIRTQDLCEVGELIADVVNELKGFDPGKRKGLFGLFCKQSNRLKSMKNRFARAEVNVEKIGDALQKHQVRILKESAILERMYENNLGFFKELTMYILAGKQKLQSVRIGKLKELDDKAKITGLTQDASAARDLANQCNRFEKRIYDLELTRTISLQMAPQIRIIQNNNIVMAEKIQTTLVNTIPLWKNQMVLALGMAHSGETVRLQRRVTDATNTILKRNAEKLRMATVETAWEAQRGIVDMETLKKTNTELIQTLDNVMKIQTDGRSKRLAAEAEIAKMENDLKNKLLQIRN